MEIQIVLQKAGEKLIYVDFKSSKIENLITPKEEREDLKKAIIFKLEKHLENVFNSMDIISNSRKQYEIISKTSNRMPEYESEDVEIEMENMLKELESAINKRDIRATKKMLNKIDETIKTRDVKEGQVIRASILAIRSFDAFEKMINKP